MYYAPHILQRRNKADETKDEFGRPVVTPTQEEWVTLCRCRCDLSENQEIELADGTIHRPTYHIVCEGRQLDVAIGDYIRAIWPDGSVKGEGKALRPKTLNYLPYAEVYI